MRPPRFGRPSWGVLVLWALPTMGAWLMVVATCMEGRVSLAWGVITIGLFIITLALVHFLYDPRPPEND